VLIAFFLGLFSFVLFMVVGSEAAASVFGDIAHIIVIVIVMGAYFFVCQFHLSRGNPNALFKDWPVMLALSAIGFVIAIVTALAEKREVFLSQGLGFLTVCFVGIFAGALAASRAARRKPRRP
jgi:cytochrome bd-type quinol oxidase subunit 2